MIATPLSIRGSFLFDVALHMAEPEIAQALIMDMVNGLKPTKLYVG